MGKGWTKRGDMSTEMMSTIFIALIFIGVTFLLLYYVSEFGKSSYFEREFYSKDLGLMIGTLQASPNYAMINYPNDIKGINVSFKRNYVETYSYNIDPSLATARVSKFNILPSSVTLVDTTITAAMMKNTLGETLPTAYTIYFSKDMQSITPSAKQGSVTPNTEKKSEACEVINSITSNLYDTEKSYIDVMQNLDGTISDGVTSNDFAKSLCKNTLLVGMANGYNNFLNNKDCEFEKRSYDEILLERKAKAAKADIIIIIYLMPKKKNDQINLYYYAGNDETSKKSKLLTCKANPILQNLKYTVNINEMNNFEEKTRIENENLFSKSKVGVILEISNLETIKSDDVSEISKAIHNAIREYYPINNQATPTINPSKKPVT